MNPDQLAPMVVLAGVFVLLGAWITLRLSRWWRRRVGRRVQHRGEASERRAIRLLRRHGYRIVQRQPTSRMRLLVDAVPSEFGVRADVLVEGPGHEGGTWIVEVKTGAKASITHRTTRRQILEYALCFDVDGVLLVDPDHASIVQIEWADDTPRLTADGSSRRAIEA